MAPLHQRGRHPRKQSSEPPKRATGLAIDKDVLDQLDAWREKHGLTRSAAITQAIREFIGFSGGISEARALMVRAIRALDSVPDDPLTDAAVSETLRGLDQLKEMLESDRNS